MSARILLVDDEEMLREMTRKVLAGVGFQVETAASGPEALDKLSLQVPDLILLDVMMPGMDGYTLCREIRSRADLPYVPIILLTALDSVENKVKGFEAGADDYIVKPFNTQELAARIQRLIASRQAVSAPQTRPREGRIISLFSLRGGAGVTSLAVNLSLGLARLWEEPVALLDMVRYAGHTALLLNQSLTNTWSDLARIPPAELDEEAIQAVLLPHESGVRTLAAPRRPEEGDLLTPEHIRRTLEILHQRFPYIVLDLPHDLSEHTLSALDNSEVILLILQPEIASVRAASMALEIFQAIGYQEKRIYTVLNWVFPREGLPLSDIERFIKHKVDLVIPYAADEFVRALNLGKPPVLETPESPLAALFEDLAMALSREEQRKQKPEHPSETWQRVVARLRRKRQQAKKA